ncbi:MAG: RdgB/HAM1 family non-canonical purine NTP pyrophosphatase [Pseudomonadota bacterium]
MRISAGETLLVATGNRGKLAEISALLQPFGVHVVSLTELGLAEPAETEFTFSGNALLKARAGAAASGLVTLADDSGLDVEALGGAPGIYTADWAEGAKGRDFGRAMEKTWGLLQAVKAPAPRRAAFCCTLALVRPSGEERVFAGRAEGQIVWPMRGAHGHGYDPIFRPDGYLETFGEMDEALKNKISHRAAAFAKLIEECFT